MPTPILSYEINCCWVAADGRVILLTNQVKTGAYLINFLIYGL